MILQINRFDTTVIGSDEDIESKRIEYEQKHCVILPKLLDPELLEYILRGIDISEFIPSTYGDDIEAEDIFLETDHPTSYLLNFLINNQAMYDIIRRVTGCGHIGMFMGRIYQMMPIPGHYDSWHDDLVSDRMVALSLNLSSEPYSGGVVQICDWKTRKIVTEVHNTGFGDAMIFRISSDLKHRVTSVTGSVPRTAFAGWFRAKPEYRSWMDPEDKSDDLAFLR